MAQIVLDGVTKRFSGGVIAVERRLPRDRRRRVHGARRAVRLRQVDAAAHDRRPRGGHRRRDLDRRPAGHRPAAEGPRHRDGLPELRALPAHDGRAEPGLRAQAAQDAEDRDPAARRRGRPHPRPRAAAQAQARGALGRPAPARRDGPRDGARAAGVPDGRAALEPRRQAARADARRARPAARPAADDHRLRDPRPDRGDDPRRPRGGACATGSCSRSTRRRRCSTTRRTCSWRRSSARRR